MQGVTDPYAGSGSEPSREVVAIGAGADADMAKPCRGIYVGVGGTVKITDMAGNAVSFVGVPAGTFMPVGAVRIWATGTTATSIVALL